MGRFINSVKISALGGLGEVGKNTYCIENEKNIIVIDAGVRFPEANLPGVNYVIPDYTRLKNNQRRPYRWNSFLTSNFIYTSYIRSKISGSVNQT